MGLAWEGWRPRVKTVAKHILMLDLDSGDQHGHSVQHPQRKVHRSVNQCQWHRYNLRGWRGRIQVCADSIAKISSAPILRWGRGPPAIKDFYSWFSTFLETFDHWLGAWPMAPHLTCVSHPRPPPPVPGPGPALRKFSLWSEPEPGARPARWPGGRGRERGTAGTRTHTRTQVWSGMDEVVEVKFGEVSVLRYLQC